MEQDQVELIVALISLVSVLATPVVNKAISSGKRSLQVTFYTNNDWASTTVVVRNVGSQTVFIDEIYLHKTFWIEFDIKERFGPGIKGPLPLSPGKTLRTTFSEIELIDFLKRSIEKGNVNRSWPRYQEFRLGFKILIRSSEGNGSTTWFKIGYWHGKGKCRQYDYLGYRKTYYELRGYHNSIDWEARSVIPIMLLLLGLIIYCSGESLYWPFMLAGYILLLCIVTLIVTDGLPNRNAIRKYSILLTVAFGLVIWTSTEYVFGTILFSMIVFVYHDLTVGKYSGWNL